MRIRVIFGLLLGFFTSFFIMTTQPFAAVDCDHKTSNIGILKSYLMPINLDDPDGDAILRSENEDYRFIALIVSYKYVPGLDFGDELVYCMGGERLLQGTGDYFDGEEYSILRKKFDGYALKFNIKMKELIIQNFLQ